MDAQAPLRRSSERAHAPPARQKAQTPWLMVWMVLAICAVATVAYWDEQREFASALADFAGEQNALAQAVAASLKAPLLTTGLAATLRTEQFGTAIRSVERPHRVQVLIRDPSGTGLTASDGRVLRSPTVEAGLASKVPWVRLSRSESSMLGLPARTAMAGLTTIQYAGAVWGVVVLATAQGERDREQFAHWRLVSSVVVASGLVLVFGGLALRTQRRQMSLAHELEVAAMQSERDERLVRADKLATMGALATGIAHEVSTPLGVIVGRAEQLLSKLNGDERSKRAVEAIVAQADRISDIIRGFLALARGDSPPMAHVGPAALGNVALDLVSHRFAKAEVHLTSVVAPDLPEIRCEPRLMEHVLVNLLLNACDACESGGHVELRVVAEKRRVAFVVTDDGTGISTDAAARIMDPFFTTKAEGQGSGLGLAITNELVKHHRGTLSVAPRQGHHGTRACVELPCSAERSHA